MHVIEKMFLWGAVAVVVAVALGVGIGYFAFGA